MKKLLLLLIPMTIVASPQGVPKLTSVTVGTSATVALPANPYRGYLIMQNQGLSSCVVSPVTPLVSPDGLIILPGQNYEMIEAFTKSAVNAQCGPGSSRIVFLETNY